MTSSDGQIVKGIILAGVHRWDKYSFDGVLPRSLVPVGHWPLISYVVDWLRGAGITQATICANSASRAVRTWLGDGSRLGMSFNYYEDWVPRGPAGCLRDASECGDADLYVIADATTLPRVDLVGLVEEHLASGATLTAVLSKERPDESNGEGSLIPTGIYVCGRAVLAFIRETGYQDIKEVLIPRLHESGCRVHAYVAERPALRVTDVGSYLALNEWIAQEIADQGVILPDYIRQGEGYLHRTTQCEAGVNLIGPVLVGPMTRINREVRIVGPTVIGAGCEIGRGTVISRSVIWDRCRIGETCKIDRCLLANETAVERGTALTHSVHCSPVRHRTPLLGRLGFDFSRAALKSAERSDKRGRRLRSFLRAKFMPS